MVTILLGLTFLSGHPSHIKDVRAMKNAGVWVGSLVLIFAGTIFFQSLTYDYYSEYGPGPGFFPLWLSGFLILLSILYIIDSIRKQDVESYEIFPKSHGARKVLTIIAALVLFLSIIPFTGYTIASVVMLFILLFREYRWYWNFVISVIVSLAIFFTFQSFLKVPLPVNTLGL